MDIRREKIRGKRNFMLPPGPVATDGGNETFIRREGFYHYLGFLGPNESFNSNVFCDQRGPFLLRQMVSGDKGIIGA